MLKLRLLNLLAKLPKLELTPQNLRLVHLSHP